ncbi:MAG: hypothetical protein PHX44_08480 [Sulfurimonas sp.]|uniref:hypothetical protein n=1 Tax=Sulfurimonas sp. TaxID=2022749 RepID=UPI002635DC58|nr:hypothetical protein [Sulfurimonas sp.]MDD2653069.1 hypothetical protein [Sulfurimonas sp.]MDD3452508.1 hypothetical protein [Sulfurimonas sp.]
MKTKNILDNTVDSIKKGADTISEKYETHIRQKAVERVNKMIQDKGLSLEQIEVEDYEAMISDISKDIKEDYAKKASQGLLAFIGLDFLFGW